MGVFFSKIWNKLIGKKDIRLLMVGLDDSGKTTILYKLKASNVVNTVPLIGHNIEILQYNGLHISAWDLGGSDKLRGFLNYYYQNTNGIIFVVNSNDKDRIQFAAEALNKLLAEEELKFRDLLVYANKQDLEDSLSPNDIIDKLGLREIKERNWLVQGTCATSGQGLKEGLDWIADMFLKKESNWKK